MQGALLLEQKYRQGSVAEAEIEEGSRRRGCSRRTSSHDHLAGNLASHELASSAGAQVLEPGEDSVRSFLHGEAETDEG